MAKCQQFKWKSIAGTEVLEVAFLVTVQCRVADCLDIRLSAVALADPPGGSCFNSGRVESHGCSLMGDQVQITGHSG